MQKIKTLDEIKADFLTSAKSTEFDLFEVIEAIDHLQMSDADMYELFDWFNDNGIRIKSDEEEFDFEEYNRYYTDSNNGDCELFAETIAIEDLNPGVSDESTLSKSDEHVFRDINDLNGYNDLWLKIKLSCWNISFASNSNNLITEFELLYKSETGNILDELEFYITTKSGSHFKPTGYLTLTGDVPKKIDVWCDRKEHKLNIGPTFSIQKNDSIIEDGLRLTMSFKDIKQSYYVRKTYELQNGMWGHEEMFAIPLNKFNG